jgi:3-methyladenine DNA glycosylase AlkD
VTDFTAKNFQSRLNELATREDLLKHRRYFRFEPDDQPTDDYFIGVQMGKVFDLAKEFIAMPVKEIELLLESPIHEARAGAVSIMGKKAAVKKISADDLKALYDLYVRRHDRINNWDLVDLGAHQVVGRYLNDKPRDILYAWARSADPWERRSAIVATAHFIRQGDVDDAFEIAEILVNDPDDLVNKGTGWMLRFAGDKEPARLLEFLDKHAGTMPRILLRYSIEKLDKQTRAHYLGIGKIPRH